MIQGVHGQVKSQGNVKFFKVRELSGNIDINQEILHFQPNVGEKSGNFERQICELQKKQKNIKTNCRFRE